MKATDEEYMSTSLSLGEFSLDWKREYQQPEAGIPKIEDMTKMRSKKRLAMKYCNVREGIPILRSADVWNAKCGVLTVGLW